MSGTSSSSNAPPLKGKDDYRVDGLESVQPAYAHFNGTMYAGTIPTNHDKRRGEMMFWLFEPETQAIPDTIVLWLNGGPGCSSFNCGVLMEHSPVTQPLHSAGYCCLQPQPDFSVNEYAWTKHTTMLYPEYPIGTGFSYGDNPETENEGASDLYQFLLNFFEIFPHLAEHKFFVTGESYAGMFVPSVARFIHRANLEHPEHHQIKLAGAALGNGWMDAAVQGPATIDYSWWHGLIDEPTRDALHVEWKNCYEKKQFGNSPFHPFNVQDDCGIMWGILAAAGNPNAYDISTWDPNVDQVTFASEAFYNLPSVKEMLHAPANITWHGCQGMGRRRLTSFADKHQQHRRLYMDNDKPLSVVPYVGELLDAGVPVLIYNGDRDMTTNMVGTELLLNRMKWKGQDNWLDASRGLWLLPDELRKPGEQKQAGWAKESQGLTFVVVYNSGHMVPYNQPAPAGDLLVRFLTGKSFIDEKAELIRVNKVSEKDQSASLDRHHEKVASYDAAYMLEAFPTSSSLALDGGAHQQAITVVLSMLVGALLAILFMKRRENHWHSYEMVV
ncbi:hypothetical protein MPSEU_000841300 [Mayamaea pseudoterrestris]|nr:hypothetical protein MPSEU_000841300 [Mayamaea pseudoterrestris]